MGYTQDLQSTAHNAPRKAFGGKTLPFSPAALDCHGQSL